MNTGKSHTGIALHMDKGLFSYEKLWPPRSTPHSYQKQLLQMQSNHFLESSNHEITRKCEQQIRLELIFIRAGLVWIFSPAAENKTNHNM